MEYTHEQAQMLHDTMEEHEGRKEEKDVFCGVTAKDVAVIYFSELYVVMWEHDISNNFDWEDWLNQKTHFVFTGEQWESYSLDLISEGNND